KYTVLAICQVVHCASGLSFLTAVCLIRQSQKTSKWQVPIPAHQCLTGLTLSYGNKEFGLYCKGKDHGEYILQSIDEGPFKMGKCRDEIASGPDGPYLGPERDRVFANLLQPEKDRLRADIRATNILLQGFPRDIYKLINHNTNAKDIWDNVKMLLEGSELTTDDRESQFYDEFEHFGQHKGENIHEYYVRFTKLINDMRHIKMTMPKIQLNSKFVNNMLPEWDIFLMEVNLNNGLKESNHDQLYAYLKQHESHANENKMLMERLNQHSHDPLALVSNSSPYQYPSSSSVPLQSSYVPPVQSPGNCLDDINVYHEEHEMKHDVQPNNVVDSDTEYMSASNIISYERMPDEGPSIEERALLFLEAQDRVKEKA
nr:integrase, catalytic region, zinc finger, CCHC-type, peptidase aspartic, catalytic [Tanacetum cinerariifolium]